MIHLRYIVYRNPNETEKQVAFWVDDIIHSTYAREKGISPQNFLSGGYMRPFFGKWIPYEHYQLDDQSAWADKSLVKREFKKHPEFQTTKLARAINQTFIMERRILRALLIKAWRNLFISRTRE